MDFNPYVMLSGLFGALIGVAASFSLARYREWLIAKNKLGQLLFKISEELEYTEKTVEEIIGSRFAELWVCGRDAANLVLVLNRKKIRDHTDLICGSMRGIMKTGGTQPAIRSFPNRDDAKRHTDDFLRLLGYK